MGRKLKIGDLFEVQTSKGLGYVQFCHRDASGPADHGPLIRAIEGLHRQRPAELEDVARRPLLFWTFYPLGAALYHKLVSYVGNFVIPEEAATFPVLRSDTGSDRSGLVHQWLILGRSLDLRKRILREVQILTEEEQRLSHSSIITHPLLVEYLEEQYRPEKNPVMLRAQRHWTAIAQRKKTSTTSQ